jgi:hypothetical protein
MVDESTLYDKSSTETFTPMLAAATYEATGEREHFKCLFCCGKSRCEQMLIKIEKDHQRGGSKTMQHRLGANENPRFAGRSVALIGWAALTRNKTRWNSDERAQLLGRTRDSNTKRLEDSPTARGTDDGTSQSTRSTRQKIGFEWS